MKTSQKQAKT